MPIDPDSELFKYTRDWAIEGQRGYEERQARHARMHPDAKPLAPWHELAPGAQSFYMGEAFGQAVRDARVRDERKEITP